MRKLVFILGALFYLLYAQAYRAAFLFIILATLYFVFFGKESPHKGPSYGDIISAQNYAAQVSQKARDMYEEYLKIKGD